VIDDPLTALIRARIAALGRVMVLAQRDPQSQLGAVGMRPMVLSDADVAALAAHIAHPSALPTLPIRAIPELEPRP
jgi:hypothetical protein